MNGKGKGRERNKIKGKKGMERKQRIANGRNGEKGRR